jgi:Suppressor of fused protein (SUFU)
MTGIDVHIERNLGLMDCGWASTEGPAGVQVCLFRDRPIAGAVTYSTLGLSKHVLKIPSGRTVRQEMLLAVTASFEHANLSKLLFHVAERTIRGGRALLRGDVVPLGYPLAPRSILNNLYVSLPVIFPEALASCEETDPATVFAWLVPISDAEAGFVHASGWSAFEATLEATDPDLLDVTRRST